MSSLNRKITSNKSKHLLVENELKKLKTFDSSYYLVFQSMYRCFKVIAGVGNGSYIYYWQSKGLRLNSIAASNYRVTQNLIIVVLKQE